jgi:hypothetical protein
VNASNNQYCAIAPRPANAIGAPPSRLLSVFLSLAVLVMSTGVPAAEPGESRLLACLCVVETHVGQPDKEYAWNPHIAAGSGKQLELILESGSDAKAVVIPWNQEQTGLANGWLPFWAKLSQDEPNQLRQERNPWLWNTNAGPFRVQAIIFHNSDKAAEEMCQLVDALKKAGVTERVLAAQIKKLQSLVDQCAGDRGRRDSITPSAPANVAGVFRNPFDWCKYAVSNSFAPGKPLLVSFSSQN